MRFYHRKSKNPDCSGLFRLFFGHPEPSGTCFIQSDFSCLCLAESLSRHRARVRSFFVFWVPDVSRMPQIGSGRFRRRQQTTEPSGPVFTHPEPSGPPARPHCDPLRAGQLRSARHIRNHPEPSGPFSVHVDQWNCTVSFTDSPPFHADRPDHGKTHLERVLNIRVSWHVQHCLRNK